MTIEPISPLKSNPPQTATQSADQAARDANAATNKAPAENNQAASETQTKTAAKGKPAVSSFADIQLKFQVDPQTQALTVLILDRSAQRLIRTIPPDELQNMQAGDLVEMLS